MSKLNVDQKTIKDLFQDKKSDFLIPDYQRPYAWDENECQTLWDDIFTFAIPDGDADKFDSSSEYFLGPIVTFKNDDGKMEIIDGQQRLTTLMLLLRALYTKFGSMQDKTSVRTREAIEQCIWKTNEFGEPNKEALKIASDVATDQDKSEFLAILRSGEVSAEQQSKYADNFRFFQKRIADFMNAYPLYLTYLSTRIMNNCILLPIEADSQDTALRIFSTLNDRGMPLADADIFKAQFYKFYTELGRKDEFVEEWKELEALCQKVFHPIHGTPMDELFSRYMYFERARKGIKSSTTEALRKFYESNGYELLKKESTLKNLSDLAHFWEDVSNQDHSRFSERVLRRLFVLDYAPNGMWTYFVSVYFMQYRDAQGQLNDAKFYAFLNKTIGFIWTYAVTNPGVGALRTPIFAEMVNIVNDKPVTFAENRFDPTTVRNIFANYTFTNGRPVTKALITWWAYQDPDQPLMSLETILEIEHIYARNRSEHDNTQLKDPRNLESLGNKALLEKRINIRASDFRFVDKAAYYLGNSKRKQKEPTQVHELVQMARNIKDFTEADIAVRYNRMMDAFIAYLKENDLLA